MIHTPGKKPFIGTVVVDAKKGTILAVTEGKIAASTKDATTIDLTGRHLFPGLIDAATILGLVEIESATETVDYRDGGDFQPDLRASVGINPDSELIPVTRANGITTVVTRPTGSIIPGQGALINLSGWTPREMVVVDPLSLHVEYPSQPIFRNFGSVNPDGEDEGAAIRYRRSEKLNRLKELFESARRYDAAKKSNTLVTTTPRFESLLPYVRGEKPVIMTADRKSDILAAFKLADELKVQPILSGGTEAWKVLGELKKRKTAVILGPIMSLPRELGDRYDSAYTSALALHNAGVPFCIRSAGKSNARNLPYEAAQAVAYGLPPEVALEAVTLAPAKILGVADQLGTIDVGKMANIVVTDGDILQATTQVHAIFINGQPHEPISKQTRLYDKYRKRLNSTSVGLSQ
jgi:imidazolonepropionase-like amidohydrolase